MTDQATITRLNRMQASTLHIEQAIAERLRPRTIQALKNLLVKSNKDELVYASYVKYIEAILQDGRKTVFDSTPDLYPYMEYLFTYWVLLTSKSYTEGIYLHTGVFEPPLVKTYDQSIRRVMGPKWYHFDGYRSKSSVREDPSSFWSVPAIGEILAFNTQYRADLSAISLLTHPSSGLDEELLMEQLTYLYSV